MPYFSDRVRVLMTSMSCITVGLVRDIITVQQMLAYMLLPSTLECAPSAQRCMSSCEHTFASTPAARPQGVALARSIT